MSLKRRVAAEFGGSLLLTGVVIGSGIMGERLAGGNAGVALLANTGATAAILYVLITGCRWNNLPREYGHDSTAWRRFKRWSLNGTLLRI